MLVEGLDGDGARGTLDRESLAEGGQVDQVADGRIAVLALEDIAKAAVELIAGARVHVAGGAPAAAQEEGAQVVHAIGLVGVTAIFPGVGY